MTTTLGVELEFPSRHPGEKHQEKHYVCLKPLTCRHTCKKNKGHTEPCGNGNCPFQRIFRRRCGHEIYRPCVGALESSMPRCTWPCAVPKNGLPCEKLCCDCGFLACTEKEKKEKQSSPVPVASEMWHHGENFQDVRLNGFPKTQEYEDSTWKQNEASQEFLAQNEDILDIGIDESIPENLIKLPDPTYETNARKTKRNSSVPLRGIPKKEEMPIHKPAQNITDLGFNVFVEAEILAPEINLEEDQISTKKMKRVNAPLKNTNVRKKIPIPELVNVPVYAVQENVELWPPRMNQNKECKKQTRSRGASTRTLEIENDEMPSKMNMDNECGKDTRSGSASPVTAEINEVKEAESILKPKENISVVGNESPSPTPSPIVEAPYFEIPPRSPSMPCLKPQNYYFEISPENQSDTPPKLTRKYSPEMEPKKGTETKPRPTKKPKISGDHTSKIKKPENSAPRSPGTAPPTTFESCLRVVRNRIGAEAARRKQSKKIEMLAFANHVRAMATKEEKLHGV